MRHERHSADASHGLASRRLGGNGARHHEELPAEAKPGIGLPGDQRHAIARMLRFALADAFVLHAKTLNFHWNVTGAHFLQLHKFLQKQYEALGEEADAIAERIRVLGGHPAGSMAEFLRDARLLEQPAGELPPERQMLSILLADNEALVRQLRKDVHDCMDVHKDAGTGDFLTGLMKKHEFTAWQLRSLLAEDHPHAV